GDLARLGGWRVLGIEVSAAASRAAALAGDAGAARRHSAAARKTLDAVVTSVADPELRRAAEQAWSASLRPATAG
ncbi:MAG: hypothetical protein ACLFWM_05975, partial [Actinomycetota bacterium]